MSRLDLPREGERALVYVHEREYPLRGSQVRALATIGTLRVVPVVPVNDLRDDDGRAWDLRHGDLQRLRGAGRVRRVAPVEAPRFTALVALAERGRAFLEHYRNPNPNREPAQQSDAVPSKARKLTYDAPLYRPSCAAPIACVRKARIPRVALDDGLKRECRAFSQEGNHDRLESDGRPTRSLGRCTNAPKPMTCPCSKIPSSSSMRVEYEWPDGRREVGRGEVLTPHHRCPHAAANARSVFTCPWGSGTRVGGGSSRSGRGGRPFDPDLADEFLQ
jgi:hypothetical protein